MKILNVYNKVETNTTIKEKGIKRLKELKELKKLKDTITYNIFKLHSIKINWNSFHFSWTPRLKKTINK